MIVITYLPNGLITSKRIEGAEYLLSDGEAEISTDVDIDTHTYCGSSLICHGERPSKYHALTENGWFLVESAVKLDVKRKRGSLLESCDWTQLPDVPLATKEAWTAYRQALRDITTQEGYPLDVVWPVPPVAAIA